MIVFSLAACKKDGVLSVDGGDTENGVQTAVGELKDTVKMKIPLAAIDAEYYNDLDAYCKAYGYTSATQKGDSVVVTMSKFSYELLVSQIGINSVRAVYDVLESGDFPYVKDIPSLDTENFSAATLSVDGNEYKNVSDDALRIVAQSCILYQIYNQDKKYKVEITVIDANTNEVIETKTYTDKNI